MVGLWMRGDQRTSDVGCCRGDRDNGTNDTDACRMLPLSVAFVQQGTRSSNPTALIRLMRRCPKKSRTRFRTVGGRWRNSKLSCLPEITKTVSETRII